MFKVGDEVRVVRDFFAENGVDSEGKIYLSNFVGYEGVIVNIYPEFDKPYEVAEDGAQFGYCFSEDELELI